MTESLPVMLYVDPTWRRPVVHTPLLFPYWGRPPSNRTTSIGSASLRDVFDASLYCITDDPRVADVILLPYRYPIALGRCPEVIHAARTVARTHRKRLLIDAMGDIDYDIPSRDVIVMKYGGYRFLKKEHEIILPPYAEDFLERYGRTLSFREKAEIPTIGFAGWSEVSSIKRAYWGLKETTSRLHGVFDARYRATKKGVFFRRTALQVIRTSPLVRTNILSRSSYSGHIHTAEKDIDTLRREFIENALASDLCLDIRGDANASTRLFEILSLGRVPLIIDTERNFPFSDELDYRTFSIVVDFRDLKQLPERVRAAYDRLSDDEWRTMQEKAREAYVRWFRLDALTPHLMKRIRALVHS